MEAHPETTDKYVTTTSQSATLEQDQRSQEDEALKTGETDRTDQHHREKKEKLYEQSDNCRKALYLIILFALTVYICVEVLIDRQIKFKNTDKFLKNLEQLKAQTNDKKPQKQTVSGLRFKDYHTQRQETKQQVLQREFPQLFPSKTQQAQFLPKQTSQARETATKNDMQASKKAKQADIDINKLTKIQQKIPVKASPKPPFISSSRRPSNTRVAGSGITQNQIYKARLRRTLVNLPFNQTNEVSNEELAYYQEKYKISAYSELPFCIVVPTYNNAKNDRYLNNIRSIVMQNYTNFHIVIIDDASTDDTGSLILAFLKTQNILPEDRYEIIRNAEQMRAMHNIRFAAQNYCKPSDIFMIIDGDDELLGRQVLKLFNANFQSNGLYFMYTNFLSVAGRAGYSRSFTQKVIKQNTYRKYPFVTSHLRAFYTQLFLNIKEEDLKDDKGQYFKAANDVAICIPILEQAHQKIAYVPELTYFYNSNTGLNNHALRLREQRANDKKVRTYTRYQEVKGLFEAK